VQSREHALQMQGGLACLAQTPRRHCARKTFGLAWRMAAGKRDRLVIRESGSLALAVMVSWRGINEGLPDFYDPTLYLQRFSKRAKEVSNHIYLTLPQD
jgi:hypothetical protein